MPKFIKKYSKKVGLPPGSLVHIGEKHSDISKITVVDYSKDHYEEKNVTALEDCRSYLEKNSTTWLRLTGIHDTQLVQSIGSLCNLHQLVLEDILHTNQRPKVEFYKEYVFIVLWLIYYNEDNDSTKYEQLSLVVGKNFVITFEEREHGLFDTIKERIEHSQWREKDLGSDYLAYALVDVIVDNYFLVLESKSNKIEEIEQSFFDDTSAASARSLYKQKANMIFLKKSIWPLREVVSTLLRNDSTIIKESTLPYLRDLNDHTVQIIEIIESIQDLLTSMLNIYQSAVSNKMNTIMKVLTVITTIFVPLTLITGIYGMNFKYMPELEWKYGYLTVLAIMGSIIFGMLVYFKRKKWL